MKILKSALLVFFILTAGFISHAQTNVATIEGTLWQTLPTTQYTGVYTGLATSQCFLNFGKNEAAYGCSVIFSGGTYSGSNTNNPGFNPMSDAPFQPKLILTPAGRAEPKWAKGKYIKDGDTITLTFSDAVVKLKRKKDVLEGELTFSDISKPVQKWLFIQNLELESTSKNRSTSSISNDENNLFGLGGAVRMEEKGQLGKYKTHNTCESVAEKTKGMGSVEQSYVLVRSNCIYVDALREVNALRTYVVNVDNFKYKSLKSSQRLKIRNLEVDENGRMKIEVTGSGGISFSTILDSDIPRGSDWRLHGKVLVENSTLDFDLRLSFDKNSVRGYFYLGSFEDGLLLAEGSFSDIKGDKL